MRKKSFSRKSEDRSNSITSGDTDKSAVKPREHFGAARATALRTEIEQDGDDDIANVGVSRVQSKDRVTKPPNGATEQSTDGLTQAAGTIHDTAHDHEPFTEHDLALALSRSHLAVPAQG